MGIGNWDWGLKLGIGIGDWDWGLGLGFGDMRLGIGVVDRIWGMGLGIGILDLADRFRQIKRSLAEKSYKGRTEKIK